MGPSTFFYLCGSEAMKLLSIFVAASLVAGSRAALAADKDGRFAVRGVGSNKCSDLTSVIDRNDAVAVQLYASWWTGYLSAANRLIGQTFDAVPAIGANETLGLVAVLCRQSKDSLVEVAAHRSLEALNAIRIRDESPLVIVQAADNQLAVREAAVTFAQLELAKLGLFKGPADGKPGAQFVQAVRSLEKTQKLAETGLPDIDVLIRLGVGQNGSK